MSNGDQALRNLNTLNLANNALAQSVVANGDAALAKRQAEAAKKEASDLSSRVTVLSSENTKLRKELELLKSQSALAAEVDRLKQENAEQAKLIAKQKDLLKDWMVSQVAFKNLFKKYGTMPDGKKPTEAAKEEVKALLDPELAEAARQIEANGGNPI